MPPRAAAANVAIVDDDSSVRKALARFLEARSFRITTFASASDFLASLAVEVPDCLILDLQMPGMTGLEMQHRLLREDVYIPTVVITAHEQVGLDEKCRSAGASAVLLKPVDGGELVSAVINAIERMPPTG
jgi:FixJ family two-component response regulator